jgi:AAA+ superfamily predicted ATPase
VAATNSPALLDRALYRRFDDVLHYSLPTPDERAQLMRNVLGTFVTPRFGWKAGIVDSEGLSHSEIDGACTDAIKQAILSDRRTVSGADLRQPLRDKREAHSKT